MAPSFDCAMSSLFCAEDNSSILYDDGADGDRYGAVVEDFEPTWHHRLHQTNYQSQNFGDEESFIGLPMQSDEGLALLVKREREHLPGCDYLDRLRNGDLDLGARKEVVDWIGKVHAHFGFGSLCAYLSINYLDRFLSVYELPKGKAWMMQLLGVACLSLAAKMEETEVPLCLDLQGGESKFVFEARTIQRMELLVLTTLKWRMQAVTPFSFIDYFLTKINGDQTPPKSSITKSIQLILTTLRGIEFLEFKPSEIAAAVAMCVAGETQVVETEKAISVCVQGIEKERVFKCFEVIQESSFLSGAVTCPNAPVPSVPQSPIGVLDAACLSYKSEETTVGSCANSSHNSPNTKKRKLNRCSEVEL